MSQQEQGSPLERQEAQLRRAARQFVYPPTPDIVGTVRLRQARIAGRESPVREGASLDSRPWTRDRRSRRLAWVAVTATVALLLVGILAVPEVRAVVQAFLRIGTIEIVVATPTPAGAPTATPPITGTGGISAYDGINLAGETTLEGAQQQVYFSIRAPTYPPDLGQPDRVFVQDLDGDLVILMWLQPGQQDRPRLVLYELTSDIIGEKGISDNAALQETTVLKRPAAWVRGAHTLELYDKAGHQISRRQLVDASVLIWSEGGITYRLETMLPQQEAVKVAESLAVPRITPLPSPTPLSVLDLAGETTLEAARQEVRFLDLPAYPPDLGEPDKVFVQDLGGQAVVLVWTQPGHPGQVRLALYEMVSATIGERTAKRTTLLQETRVSGNHARWVRGPHELEFRGQSGVRLRPASLVDGNALHWSKGAITYRLETTLPLEEAVRIAESIP
jgi:hypothetical protein